MEQTNPAINEARKRLIIAVIKALFPTAKIYLFGSRARGTHHDRSDIDIAIDTGKKEERVDVGEARNMLNESNIPYKIDVVDLNGAIPEAMRKNILQEGILWTN